MVCFVGAERRQSTPSLRPLRPSCVSFLLFVVCVRAWSVGRLGFFLVATKPRKKNPAKKKTQQKRNPSTNTIKTLEINTRPSYKTALKKTTTINNNNNEAAAAAVVVL